MLRRLWLIFAQATTVGLALLFIVSTLRPEWIDRLPTAPASPAGPPEVAIRQATAPDAPRANALTSHSDAVNRAAPAVVNVYTTQEVQRRGVPEDPLYRYFFGDPRGGADRVASLGSGVIVSADGYVLTNNHVVQARRRDRGRPVRRPQARGPTGRRRPEERPRGAQDRGEGPAGHHLRALRALKVGDVVLAIGNPFGVGQTVTMGIVSAQGRANLGIDDYEDFIQTDAAINPGNSGGALVNSDGQLVGINTAIVSRTGGSIGIGFAIPSALVIQVMDQLIKPARSCAATSASSRKT